MIASKFVKCISKLFNLNPYHYLLPNFKHANNPKFITVKEAEKLNIEKLCENLDLENTFKLRNCNRPSCKSDVSMLKESNYKYPPACHSVPCCNSNLSNFSGQIISKCQTKVSSWSKTDAKSTRSRAKCSAPLKECKSAIYILDQCKQSYPREPFSEPCSDDAIRAQKLCENLDFENTFKLRDCNRPSSCKSDVCVLKESNYQYPPACHSVSCCNSNLSNSFGRKVSAWSITDAKSTRNQATCTAPMKESRSEIYVLDQRKQNYPKKPFSAPCSAFNHTDAIMELCDKAMKTCAEARKIINFYKYFGPEEDSVCQIESNPDIELADKNQNLGSNIQLEITPCPYCTQPSSIPQNYSCPFCAKNVKHCTCIHCPHCKKSRITASRKKLNQSKTKFFKFDKPLSYPPTGKTNPPDSKILEELSASKSEDTKKRAKSSSNKNRKTRSLSPDELHTKPTKKKLKQSRGQSQEPLLKKCDKILKKKDFAKNIPNEEKLQIPWMPPNEAKICAKLRSQLNPNMRNSVGDRILNEDFQKKCKPSEKKVKMCVKQENVEKKQKDSKTSATLKQSKDGKKAIKLQKKWDNSSNCSLKMIYPAKSDRPLPLNKNGNSVRNYSSKKKEDGSQPQDFLCDCPKAVRKIGRCEKMEYDEYFGDCYKCREYFKYHKYSYFTMEECMQHCRLPQPSSKEKDDCD